MAAAAREIGRPDAASRIRRVADRFCRSISIVPFEERYLASGMKVAREIHAHSIYRDLPLDEKKLYEQLSMSGTGDAKSRYFRLAVRGDEVLGGFYGVALRMFFCDALIAKDMGWWVRESARGGAAAILLLYDFEAWARSIGASKLGVGQSGVENLERTRLLFENCGFTVTGFNTSKDL